MPPFPNPFTGVTITSSASAGLATDDWGKHSRLKLRQPDSLAGASGIGTQAYGQSQLALELGQHITGGWYGHFHYVL